MATKPKKDLVLRIDPDDAIVFKGNFAKEVTVSYLTLFNPSGETVAYKVKTTAPRRYCVRPNSGKIDPNAEQKVKILLQPNTNNDDLSKHKFLVQTLELTAETMEMDVENLFKSKNPNLESSSKKLLCKFIDQEDTGPEALPAYSEVPGVETGSKAPLPYSGEEDSRGVGAPFKNGQETPLIAVEHAAVQELAGRSNAAPKREVQFEQQPVREVKQEVAYDSNLNLIESNKENIIEAQNQSAHGQQQGHGQIINKASVESPVKQINRPTIQAVPTEPKVINPVTASPVKVVRPAASRLPAQPAATARDSSRKVENTSKYTTISHEELKGLKDTIKNLELQLKTVSSGGGADVSSSEVSLVENNNLFWKSIVIIGLLTFIFGWMLSSMLCKC